MSSVPATAADADDHGAAVASLTRRSRCGAGPALGRLLDGADLGAEAQRLEELRLSALESRIEARAGARRGRRARRRARAARAGASVARASLRGADARPLPRPVARPRRWTCSRRPASAWSRSSGSSPAPSCTSSSGGSSSTTRRSIAPRRFPPLSRARRRSARRRGSRLVALAGAHRRRARRVSAGATDRPPSLAAGVEWGRGGGRGIGAGSRARRRSPGPRARSPQAAVRCGWPIPVATRCLPVDPGSGVVVDRIPVGGEPGSIVSGDGAIWVASTVGSTVTRIDPTTDTVDRRRSRFPAPTRTRSRTARGGLWVADSVEHELFEIDPATDALERTMSAGSPAERDLDGRTAHSGSRDTATRRSRGSTRASGRVIGHVHVGDGPAALAFGSRLAVGRQQP